MTDYQPQKFNLPTLSGLSQKTIETHIKLYEGYVKNVNLILSQIEEYSQDSAKNAYALGELQRRFAFEFDGMRNHEYYFGALEGGAQPLPSDSPLALEIAKTWESIPQFMARFKALTLTRGIGWAALLYDPAGDRLLMQWVDEQHLGHLVGLHPIIMLDMWEHSYFLDYAPADKAKYVDAYFENFNWAKINEWFVHARTA
ncbi:hypothetical protein IPJ70_02605 [Candidatus Campbellbacteria bacterium]|nr:MAG: hypothetical protein IPJ70_02605 [Candidatus Campbellbacteria bacterium]